MKRFVLAALALAFISTRPLAQTPTTSRFTPIQTMLDGYCVTCHSVGLKAGGVVFADVSKTK